MSISNLARALLGLVIVCNLALTQDSEGDEPANGSDGETGPEGGLEEEKCVLINFNKDTYVEFHNSVRRKAGSSDMIELHWDDNLAKNAAKWVKKCTFEVPRHYAPRLLLHNHATFETMDDFWGALETWKAEEAFYDDSTGGCYMNCRHYLTLVTWNIATFGCAVALCNEVNSSYTQFPDLGLYYLACEYYAPDRRSKVGHIPHTKGSLCSSCPSRFPVCSSALCSTTSSYPAWNHSEIPREDEGPKCRIVDKAALIRSSAKLLIVQLLFVMTTTTMMNSQPIRIS